MKNKKFFTELAVSAGILVGINILIWPNQIGFIHVAPHPYWFPILMLAALYGIRAALISAILYSVIYLICYYYNHSLALETFFSFKMLKQPILFITIAYILGRMTQVLKDTIQEWKRKHSILRKDREQIAKELNASTQIKQDLERRLVSQLTTISTVYDFAKQLETYDGDSLYKVTLKTLIEHLNIDQASFYKADHNLLKLVSTEFKDHLSFQPPAEVNKAKGVFSIAIDSRRTVTIRELFSEIDFETLRNSPMMCAPLHRKNGQLIGVITVDKISFVSFTPTTVKLFSIMVQWLANAIDNALHYDEAKKKNILDELLGFYNYGYFERRFKEEFGRTKRYSLPLSLLLFHIKQFDDLKPESKLPLQKSLASLFLNSVRDIDIVSLYRWEDTWSIVFPTFPKKEAQKTCDNLQEKIKEFSFEPYKQKKSFEFEMVISDFNPNMKTVEELITEAESQLSRSKEPKKQELTPSS